MDVEPLSSARGAVIGLDVDFMLENPITVVPMCHKYVWHPCSSFYAFLMWDFLNEISRGSGDRKLWILRREASLDGFCSADGKLYS